MIQYFCLWSISSEILAVSVLVAQGRFFLFTKSSQSVIIILTYKKRGYISMTNEKMIKLVSEHNESDMAKVDFNLYVTKDFIINGGVLNLNELKSKALENSADD